MSDIADLFPDGTFTAGPDQAEEPDEVEEELVDEADDGEESGEDTPDDAAAEVEQTPEDYRKALEDTKRWGHENAERAKRLEEQLAALQAAQQQPEETVDDDPYGLWGTALGNDEAQQLAQRMIERPHEAQQIYEYVEANQHQFGPAGEEIADQMFALWHAQNPRAATRWFNEQQWSQHQQQIAEQQAPVQSHYTQQMASLAVHRATNGPDALPRFGELQAAIMDKIQTPDMQQFLASNPEYARDPEKMFQVLKGAWTSVIADEYRTNQQHATTASTPAADAASVGITAKAKPRTQQRSTAKAPTQIDADDLFPSGTFREG